MRLIRRLAAAGLLAVALAAIPAQGAFADDFHMNVDNAVLDLGQQTGVKAIDSDNGDPPATLDGSIDASGNVNVPVSGFVFPEKTAAISPGITATINMSANEPITGKFTASTGQLDLTANLHATVAVLGSTCIISPVKATLSTENSTPYLGVPFTDGLTGKGAVDGSWSSLPAVTWPPSQGGAGSCGLVGQLISGPGGIWMAQQIHDPTTCATDPGNPRCKNPPGGCTSATPACCAQDPTISGCTNEPCHTATPDCCKQDPTIAGCTAPPTPQIGKFKVTPRSKRVKPRKKVVFKAKVSNTGKAAAAGARICVKAPKKKVKVKGGKCKSGSIPAGGTLVKKFKLKLTRKARGKIKVRFKLSVPGVPHGSQSQTAKIKVKRHKKKHHRHGKHHKHGKKHRHGRHNRR